MPISLQYGWRDLEDRDGIVEVRIPFKGKSIDKTDIFLSNVFIKVSHPPFLLSIDLANKIDVKNCRAIKRDNELILLLKKASNLNSSTVWQSLVFEGTKTERVDRREQSIRQREAELKQIHENARTNRLEEERMTLKKQMALDRNELDRIDELKKLEKEVAEEAVYQSIARMAGPDLNDSNIASIKEKIISTPLDPERKIGDTKRGSTYSSPNTDQASFKLSETPEVKERDAEPKPRPHVRSTGVVKFKHSHRFFKTPKRESTELQEQIFLAKNSPHLKQNKYLNADGTSSSNIEETDPAWLKRKGDDYYHGGDFFAAINAYSIVIAKDDVNTCSTYLPSLLNRAACYMHIGEFGHCIHDCEAVLHAIEMDNKKKRGHNLIPGNDRINGLNKKALVRLASAYCQLSDEHSKSNRLERMEKAQEYLRKASSIDNNDNYLGQDLKSLEGLIAAFRHKQDGDKAFGSGKSKEAIDLYSDAIKEHGSLLSAFANRAAATYEIGEYQDCIKDCKHVLDTLKNAKDHVVSMDRSSFAMSMGGIPSPGTNERASLVKSCLCRRAAAYQKLSQMTLALKDLRAADNFFGESCPELANDIQTVLKAKQ